MFGNERSFVREWEFFLDKVRESFYTKRLHIGNDFKIQESVNIE